MGKTDERVYMLANGKRLAIIKIFTSENEAETYARDNDIAYTGVVSITPVSFFEQVLNQRPSLAKTVLTMLRKKIWSRN